MTVDFRRLEHFLTVAEKGSINSAAERCNISQAGLTKSIRALESQLGATLFERGPRGVTLTRQGHMFFRHAKQMQNQSLAATNAIAALSAGIDVELRIGVSMRWTLRLVMPAVLAKFARDDRHPRITVLSGRKSWQMIEDLRDGELDLLLATPTEQDDLSGFEITYFRHDPQRIVVRKGHPLASRGQHSLSDLYGYDWVSGPPETYFRRYLEGLFMAEGLTPPRPRYTSDSNTLILDTIARTDLLGISTERMISVDHADKIVMLDTPGKIDRTTAILARSGDVLPDTARDLIQAVSDEIDWLRGAREG